MTSIGKRMWHAGALLTLATLSVSAVGTHRVVAKPTAVKATAPAVYPVSAASLKKAIAARRGKVVLVNFWATWCVGCRKEFPDLVKLQKNYAKQGVTVLFVSGDEAKDRAGKVVPFLKQQRVTSPSYIIQGDVFQFIPQFDPKLKTAFGLPRTYIYNRSGKLVKVVFPEKSYAEFSKMLKPLL
jgi:thiol-disulfide isomerase/thioredoxin